MTLQSFLKLPLKVLRLEQNSPEWFKARLTKRTASETPIVLNVSPWVTPGQLAMEKFSPKPPKRQQSAATQHGHDNEPIARRVYEAKYERVMKPCCVVRGDYMASLDGWSKDRKLILEIKSPYRQRNGDTWRDADNGEIADHYWYQVQSQLMVSGAERCHFVVFDSGSREIKTLTIKPDLKSFQEILDGWEAFIKKYG